MSRFVGATKVATRSSKSLGAKRDRRASKAEAQVGSAAKVGGLGPRSQTKASLLACTALGSALGIGAIMVPQPAFANCVGAPNAIVCDGSIAPNPVVVGAGGFINNATATPWSVIIFNGQTI